MMAFSSLAGFGRMFDHSFPACAFLSCFLFCKWRFIIIIYPFTARVVGAPQMISQPMEWTNEIISRLISLARPTGFP